MKKILLTGATGFLGSHLLEGLLSKKHEVIILKRSTSDVWRINHLLHRVKVYDVDIVPLNKIFSENSIDIIIHLATQYKKFDNGAEINEMIASNVTFPVELLETGIRKGVKGFINTGTFFEYDCSKLPVNEDAKIKPFNLYARTKLAFESILSTYSEKLNIKTLRLFSPYGEKDNYKLISMVIQKALSKEKIVLSEGLQKLDFIYVSDIVEAYLKAIERMNDGETGYRIYNIGSGVATSVREVVSIIEQKLGEALNKEWGAASKVDIPIVFADISRAVKELRWTPKYSISKGISDAMKYHKGREA